MFDWKNCLLICWMLPTCVSGITLSPEMTLIVSVAFGSLLCIIIIAVMIGCICIWCSKKQDLEEDSSSRRNRLRRLNSIHPSREISMAEFEYLHNKSRAEYAMMQRNAALPGYMESEEPSLHPEFCTNGNNRSITPPPPYEHDQERTIASAPPESELPPLSTTRGSSTHANNTPTTRSNPNQRPSSTSATRNNKRSQRSGKMSNAEIKDDTNDKTTSKKNQNVARIINVEDPDKLRLKKIALANKLKQEIETGENSLSRAPHDVNSYHNHERDSSGNEPSSNSPQDDRDGNNQTKDKNLKQRVYGKQTGNETQSQSYRNSHMPLQDIGYDEQGDEERQQSSLRSEIQKRDNRSNKQSTDKPSRPNNRNPPIRQPSHKQDDLMCSEDNHDDSAYRDFDQNGNDYCDDNERQYL